MNQEEKTKEQEEIFDARKKLAERMGESSRLGGKHTERRKHKAVHKTQITDDKKLKQSMKKFGLQPLPQIEEVNLFKDDKSIIHITKPEEIKDLFPDILTQLGPKQIDALKDILESKKEKKTGPTGEVIEEAKEEDENVPELVQENFEEYSKVD